VRSRSELLQAAATSAQPRRKRDREDGTPQPSGLRRCITGATTKAGLDHHEHVGQSGEAGVSRKERAACRGLVVGNERQVGSAFIDHAPEQRRILRWIGLQETSRSDHGGGSARRERAAMCSGVDAARATGQDRDACGREFCGEIASKH
jgi:hypothetical protein